MLRKLVLILALAGAVFAGQHSEPYSWTDYSGSITSGSVAQTIAPANAKRKYLIVQNISDTAMYLNVGAVATAGAGSFLLTANGGSYVAECTAMPLGYVSLICGSSSKAFTAKEASGDN